MNAPVFVDLAPATASFEAEVLAGLTARPRALSPKWFYDALGSKLFEAITLLPEYYPTRTELALFDAHADAIGAAAGRGRVLLELGSGAGEKVRRLLPALAPSAYIAVDVSRDALQAATAGLSAERPDLPVYALCQDFAAGLSLPPQMPTGARLVFYPGSSIGNFAPDDAVRLLAPLARSGDALLIGVDLVKAPATLVAAYDDPTGVTAAFDLNLLARINRELHADFDLRRWRHVAVWNDAARRIEMHLEAQATQTVTVAGHVFAFEAGERIHTESSYKYDPAGFVALAARAGWRHRGTWTDVDSAFAELLFVA
ncbi:MAG: L-histidine N(alpha)-methyltransferase [Burkholderiales bacterium]|jgi:dimethylhistidine N-methyltransferase|nr:L-histidine N(alpha)-methyltransferase [Burkholderiales bacterium]